MNVVRMEDIQDVIVLLRNQSVIIDADVAKLYGVETKRINEAVKNNPDRFPADDLFEVTRQEFDFLRSKFSTAKFAKTRATPKVFTEKGLYMIATILRSKKAVEAAFGIIETFAKIRELSRTVKALSVVRDDAGQKGLMQRSGELITEILDDDLETNGTETSIELNFAVLRFKHTIRKKKDQL